MSTSTYNLGKSVSHLLHRAQQIAADRSAQDLREAGITLRQFSVLSAISEEEGISQSRLVDLTGVDRSTLADMAARMEAKKLIKRAQSKTDARAKSLTLTAAGRKALDKAKPGVLAADEGLMELLGVTKANALLKSLSTLTEEVEAAVAPETAPPIAAKPVIKTRKKVVSKVQTEAAPVKKKKVAKRKKK